MFWLKNDQGKLDGGSIKATKVKPLARGTMENILDRLSAARCATSTELDFILIHFYDALPPHDTLKTSPFSKIYKIICPGSLGLESGDKLHRIMNIKAPTRAGKYLASCNSSDLNIDRQM
jgi:hypothetical protein